MENPFEKHDYPGLVALAQRLNHLSTRMFANVTNHEALMAMIEELRLESETLNHGLDKALAHAQASESL